MTQKSDLDYRVSYPGIMISKILRPLQLLGKRIWRSVCRRRVLRTVRECGHGLKVGGLTTLTRNTYLGNNVNFNGLKIAGAGKVVIGDNFHSGEDCLFITQIHNYNQGTAIPYDGTYILQPITIEDNVWLGSRVIVLGGVTIGEGAIVQAGSCVVKDIPKCAIAGGHPAQVFKYRDIEHYERLKQAGSFH